MTFYLRDFLPSILSSGPGIYKRTAIAPNLLCDLGQGNDTL